MHHVQPSVVQLEVLVVASNVSNNLVVVLDLQQGQKDEKVVCKVAFPQLSMLHLLQLEENQGAVPALMQQRQDAYVSVCACELTPQD